MSAIKPVLATVGVGSTHVVGDGFPVRNLFPSNPLGEAVSPFLLLDYAGPREFPPSERQPGVGEHPHRGIETVTLVYQGRIAHRDSGGNAGEVGPGDVQWMTAASGVVHEELHAEEFARTGGVLQMVQLWVNLPRRDKLGEPRYQELLAAEIPEAPLGADGRLRVIAGELGGVRGPAQTFSPLGVFDGRLAAGTQGAIELPEDHGGAAVVLEGRVRVNGASVGTAELAVLAPEGVRLELAAEEDALVLLLAGRALGEPVVSHGPFVMNTRAEIHQAVRDYQAGRMGRLS